MSLSSNNKQLSINIISNYISFLIYGICNVIIVGYLVRKLGKEAFGIVSLIISLTTIVEVLGDGVCQALIKYLSEIDYEKLKDDKAFQLVNTAFWWFVGAGIIGFIFCFFVSQKISYYIDIPENIINDTEKSIMLLGVRVLLLFPFNIYKGIVLGNRRYELINLSRIIMIAIRLIIIIAFCQFFNANIILYVIAVIISLIIERILWLIFKIRYCPQIKLRIRICNKQSVKLLLSFGVTMLVIHVSNLIGYESIKWIIGNKLNITDVGGYSLIASIVIMVGELIRAVSNAIMPFASKNQAEGKSNMNVVLLSTATKYTTLIALALCILPLFFLDKLFHIWVGENYSIEYREKLVLCTSIVLVGQWYLSGIAGPTIQMATGVGKIRVPAMITISWTLMSTVIIFIVLCNHYPDLYSVVIIMTVARVVAATVHILYGFKIFALDKHVFFFDSVLKPCISGLITIICMILLTSIFSMSSILNFIIYIFIAYLIFLLAVWNISLTNSEKNLVKRIVKRITLN